jgi:hypothetical protein
MYAPKPAQCGCLAGKSTQPLSGGVAPGEIPLGLDARAAQAAAARRQLGTTAARACMHLVARLGQAHRRDRPEDSRGLVLAAGRVGRLLARVSRTAAPEERTTASSRSDRHARSLRDKRTRGQANGSIAAVIKGNPAYPGAYGRYTAGSSNTSGLPGGPSPPRHGRPPAPTR